MFENKKKDKLSLVTYKKLKGLRNLVNEIQNTTVGDLYLKIKQIEDIDSVVLNESNPETINLIKLLKTITDDLNVLKQIDYENIINLANVIDNKVLTASDASDNALLYKNEAQQIKYDIQTLIADIETYNPTSQERRYKADLFGIKLL